MKEGALKCFPYMYDIDKEAYCQGSTDSNNKTRQEEDEEVRVQANPGVRVRVLPSRITC